jgi:hypothetical protein
MDCTTTEKFLRFSLIAVQRKVPTRETREGWPLLTVETEVNGDSRVQIKGVPSWLVPWACRACTRYFCSVLAALVGTVQNIFSSP